MSPFVVLSDEVQAGKSSLLLKWVNSVDCCTGFITPRREGKMFLYSIGENSWLPYEMEPQSEGTIRVGRYHLNENTITKASLMIQNYSENPSGHFIIDEVGRLEIHHHRGFEPAFSALMEKVFNPASVIQHSICVVVRKSLLDDFCQKYGGYPMVIYPDFLSLDLSPETLFM